MKIFYNNQNKMKTIKEFIFLLCSAILVTACDQVTYKKTPGGMPYQLFPGNSDKSIKVGDYVKLNLTQKINDSLVFTSADKVPVYSRAIETPYPYDISELWTKLKKGDSVIATQMMDTFINRNPGNVPPQYKKGDRILTYVKILDVFETDSAYQADDTKEKENRLKSDVAFMAKYIADKKINAQRTPSGAYVEIIKPGQGPLIDSGKYVLIRYRGVSFSGKVFDTNMDSSFGKKEPYGFVEEVSTMIKGFTEGMKFLRKGAVAKFYIPSMLGYGPQPNSAFIKPYEHIMFDIVVTDVLDKAPAPPVQTAPPQVADSMQKKKPVKKKN